jgi:flavin reductase (DIM6/NTAB) family NADH-FMN oxidoreductase RutF
MAKIKVDKNVFGYPMPVVLVGTEVGGKPNFMAVAWVSRVNYQPPMIGFASGKAHYSNEGFHKNNTFSINIPSEDLIRKTDYCGITSGKNADKSSVFKVFRGELLGAPMADDCPLCMECKLVNGVDLGADYFFIGEIVNSYCEEDCLTQENPDIEKIRPFCLSMPDNRYLSVGKALAKAWSAGKEYSGKLP